MTQDEIKMVLEALEKNTKHLPADFDYHFEAITVIKEALAQPERHELQAKGEHPAPCARFCEANAFRIAERGYQRQICELSKKLKEALAQPEQNLSCKSVQARLATSWGYVKAQPEQERPQNCGTGYCSCIECVMEPPPQRTWVDLTYQEITEVMGYEKSQFTRGLIQSALAKLKEKNTP